MRTTKAYMCRKVTCAQVLKVGERPSAELGKVSGRFIL